MIIVPLFQNISYLCTQAKNMKCKLKYANELKWDYQFLKVSEDGRKSISSYD